MLQVAHARRLATAAPGSQRANRAGRGAPPWAGRCTAHAPSPRRCAACRCPPAWERLPGGPQCGFGTSPHTAARPALRSSRRSGRLLGAREAAGQQRHSQTRCSSGRLGAPLPVLLTMLAARTTMARSQARCARHSSASSRRMLELLPAVPCRAIRRSSPGVSGVCSSLQSTQHEGGLHPPSCSVGERQLRVTNGCPIRLLGMGG